MLTIHDNPHRCEWCRAVKKNPLGLCECGRFPSPARLELITCPMAGKHEGCRKILNDEVDKNPIWEDKRYCSFECIRTFILRRQK